jgi:plasmid stability protein
LKKQRCNDIIRGQFDIIEGGMAQLIVRNLEDSVKLRLKARAMANGRSLEAEVRAILGAAAFESLAEAPVPKGFGTQMQERFGRHGLTPLESSTLEEALSAQRSRRSIRLAEFDR